MLQFTTTILQFNEQGEKTGWSYIEVPADIAGKLKPGNKKSFRVKGWLDKFAIKGVALMPMGNGTFIMPVNAAMRKGTGKRKGAMLSVKLEVDESPFKVDKELLACLNDEPKAKAHFNKMALSHQRYFNNWIESAKTIPTKTKRIAQAVNALARGMDFGAMIREIKRDKDNYG